MRILLKRISYPLSLNIMVLLLSLTVIFHLLVMTGAIPFEIVWGGKLASKHEMLRFESVSLVVNLLLLFVLSIKGGWLRIQLHQRTLNIVLRMFAVVFFLNTLGNLFAETVFEKLAFTPLTLLFCVLLMRIALEDRTGEELPSEGS